MARNTGTQALVISEIMLSIEQDGDVPKLVVWGQIGDRSIRLATADSCSISQGELLPHGADDERAIPLGHLGVKPASK